MRHLKDDPADLELATEIAQKIRLIAPDAELPRLPGEERRPRPRRAPGAALSRLPVPERLRRSATRRRPRAARAPAAAATARARRCPGARPSSQWGSAAVRCWLVVIVLGVAGAFSSGSDDAGTPSTTTGTTTTANTGAPGLPAHRGPDRQTPATSRTRSRSGRALQAAAASNPGRLRDPGKEEGGHQTRSRRPSRADSRSFR